MQDEGGQCPVPPGSLSAFFKTWTASRASGAAFGGLVCVMEGQEKEKQVESTGCLLDLQLLVKKPVSCAASCWYSRHPSNHQPRERLGQLPALLRQGFPWGILSLVIHRLSLRTAQLPVDMCGLIRRAKDLPPEFRKGLPHAAAANLPHKYQFVWCLGVTGSWLQWYCGQQGGIHRRA